MLLLRSDELGRVFRGGGVNPAGHFRHRTRDPSVRPALRQDNWRYCPLAVITSAGLPCQLDIIFSLEESKMLVRNN